ncbi:hypothetical protein EUZ85_19420 [Hahella sp. KA22]|uniref:phage antirepressor KilAC domain-containing protein n=1 Tax=Hahella sp. KA22 TaxID=1628392 RepID=UPI000FDE3198|nr:phage antirepressor KilAC domain-containing protein [Hahella sp. KA22]AZZ92774.1 hypothetical protein ENC22_16840 [Hahella sp. KA22]QAY56148.1 hypothetical protein EUZ85_19420 [Hahella sp. KA22]
MVNKSLINGNTYTMQEAAGILDVNAHKLFAHLRDQNILNDGNKPHATYIHQGYFKTKRTYWTHSHLGEQEYVRPLVTEKGLRWLDGIVKQAPAGVGLRNCSTPDYRGAFSATG